MSFLRKIGLFTGIALAISHQSSNATELTGACYDYATREAKSAVAYDSQAVGILLANNVVSTALGASGSFSLLAGLYPFVYSATNGGIFEETTDGADPQIVGCLAQLDNRISNLEAAFLEQDLIELKSILSLAKSNIIDLGNLAYHKTTADKFQALAVIIGERISTELDKINSETAAKTKASYDSIIFNVAPAYLSIIQMELLHRKEFNRFCYSQANYPTWAGIDSDQLINPIVLKAILAEDSLSIDDFLITPDGSPTGCNADYNTYLTFNRIVGEEFDSYKNIIEKLGITIVENDSFPGLISTSVNIGSSDLNAYRETFITECNGNKYTDNYYNKTYDAGSNSLCNQWRDTYLERIRDGNVFDLEAERNLIIENLASIVDSWDWYNHVLPEFVAQIEEDTAELYEAFAVETYSGVRLKHRPTNKCVGLDGKVQYICNSSQNHFMIQPYLDGFRIARVTDNRNFKDKGADSDGFVIRSSLGTDAVWKLPKTTLFDAYSPIANENTGRCLIVGENTELTMGDCATADPDAWEINGVDIPTHGPYVRLRHTGENVCIASHGTINCDDNALIYQLHPYNNGYRVALGSKNMKDKGDGIRFLDGLGDVATWDLFDLDTDGNFSLRNRQTQDCLAYEENIGFVAGTCEFLPSLGELFAIETVDLPTAENARTIKILASGFGAGNQCLSNLSGTAGQSTAFRIGHCGLSRISASPYNGGYLIIDLENDSYIEDTDNGFSYTSLAMSESTINSTTWDFIGPFQHSDGSSFFQIKNRATGHCLAPELNGSVSLLGKTDCSNDTSKIWTYYNDQE
ncbi:hypothetical protein [uncultured Microbulbifer sp.]|uniref:hypothetical protein n=1 Tax=uncultured Microbulbifer sp. TaxID=348147 RepID=UPI002611B7CD|nr:hypothetical protein [uncultured Microbulbifer sp.]